MTATLSREISDTTRQRVQKSAPTTMVGAAIMLFFGFMYLNRPDGTDLFSRAALVLYYTLRIGGLAFVAVAVVMYQGRPLGLLLDGILALPCGAILITCGVLMLVDGGGMINAIILVFCGFTFFPTGWNNLQEYLRIRNSYRISDNS